MGKKDDRMMFYCIQAFFGGLFLLSWTNPTNPLIVQIVNHPLIQGMNGLLELYLFMNLPFTAMLAWGKDKMEEVF